ncbi:MraY family glycosyltransferase [Bdellovibrio svalbardensis]|uniref:Undecaprenyl/decaprenyl-phosphate alpha-N-acetylglucosaminyl 1-phosphate transferase n=1 Tax=Bdellovibrio svalbardensis TaxID=2972972 RepID=A0ABT6DL97_9BACT|nr:MraY family glycosyltransferase [Bdellovibrio svalbardensis]MDG0817359.1 undecaprenyl/decaprenyl-phosphate alpha-N-acetylglucosaminyl 1-phosphate transferase [Bdellovibrio svalbardensis]
MIFYTVLPFLTSLAIAVFSIPIIIRVADLKHLMDEPDSERKIHSKKTPTLGGIAIFAGTTFAFSSFSDFLRTDEIHFMIPALVLLFFAGVKDDILLLAPWKKLSVQIGCAALLTVLGNLRLTNLWGMFEIGAISEPTGIVLTIIIIVSLINAFNLIDGANGLAGGLGLISSIFFGVWFALTNSFSLSTLAFSLAGALLGFLFFNFNHAKIFMGDTGSMIIGFIISILAIKFIEGNRMPGVENSALYIKAAPGVAIAAVLIPLLDMTRVFIYRLFKKRNPFSADRNHIHHLLIDMGLSHVKVSVTLYAASLFFLGVALYLRNLRSMDLVIILVLLSSFLKLSVIASRRYCCSSHKNQLVR